MSEQITSFPKKIFTLVHCIKLREQCMFNVGNSTVESGHNNIYLPKIDEILLTHSLGVHYDFKIKKLSLH